MAISFLSKAATYMAQVFELPAADIFTKEQGGEQAIKLSADLNATAGRMRMNDRLPVSPEVKRAIDQMGNSSVQGRAETLLKAIKRDDAPEVQRRFLQTALALPGTPAGAGSDTRYFLNVADAATDFGHRDIARQALSAAAAQPRGVAEARELVFSALAAGHPDVARPALDLHFGHRAPMELARLQDQLRRQEPQAEEFRAIRAEAGKGLSAAWSAVPEALASLNAIDTRVAALGPAASPTLARVASAPQRFELNSGYHRRELQQRLGAIISLTRGQTPLDVVESMSHYGEQLRADIDASGQVEARGVARTIADLTAAHPDAVARDVHEVIAPIAESRPESLTALKVAEALRQVQTLATLRDAL